MQPESYVLGHNDPEILRLERQGQFLAPLTRGVLQRAGLRPGMRVLDFGAGVGDVSLLAAELVGPTGDILALDRAEAALGRARARFDAHGLHHIQCSVGDEHTAATFGTFDAIIGRLVLLHQPDPTATVVRLARLLRPGGVLVFHEIEMGAGMWCQPALPLAAQAFTWICDTFQRGGMAADIGARIAAGFEQSDLVEPTILREGRVESGAESGGYEYLSRVLRTLLPVAERLGVVGADAVDIDTLEERLRAEAMAADARFIPVFFTAAWAVRSPCAPTAQA